MESTIVYWAYMGIKEKKMETTIWSRVSISSMLRFPMLSALKCYTVVSIFFSIIPILPQYTIVVSIFFSIILRKTSDGSCRFQAPAPCFS